MRYQHQKHLPTEVKPYIPEQPLNQPVQKATPKTKKKKKKKMKIKKQPQTMEARRLDQYPIDLELEIFDPYFLPQLEMDYEPIIIDIHEEPYQEDNILTPQHTDNIIVRLWIKEYELTESTIRKTRLLELIQSGRSIKNNNQIFQK
jgi:hypothetical protein